MEDDPDRNSDMGPDSEPNSEPDSESDSEPIMDPDGNDPRNVADGNPFAELNDLDVDPPETDLDEFFEEVEVPDIDEEAVWDAVMDADTDLAEVGGNDPSVDGDQSETIVPTETYCRTCEHFSDPPEIACTNPGTEIIELVGVDRFRVRDCPVVEQRRRAESAFPDEIDT